MTDDHYSKILATPRGYAAFAGSLMDLPRIAELLPPGTAFTATTAARCFGWMSVQPEPPEVYVAVPTISMRAQLRTLRFGATRIIPVLTEGLDGETAIEVYGESEDRFPLVSRMLTVACLLKVAEFNPQAMRRVLATARSDMAEIAASDEAGGPGDFKPT